MDKKHILIAFDLYWLRFKKPRQQWYELTDFVRDALREKGHTVDYTADDVIIDGYSMKDLATPEELKPCHCNEDKPTPSSARTSGD